MPKPRKPGGDQKDSSPTSVRKTLRRKQACCRKGGRHLPVGSADLITPLVPPKLPRRARQGFGWPDAGMVRRVAVLKKDFLMVRTELDPSPRGTRCAGLHPREGSSQSTAGSSGQGAQPHQVESQGQGGACLCGDQTRLWFYQGPLSWVGQECQRPVCTLCIDQCVPGPTAIAVPNVGKVRPKCQEQRNKTTDPGDTGPDDIGKNRAMRKTAASPKCTRVFHDLFRRSLDQESHFTKLEKLYVNIRHETLQSLCVSNKHYPFSENT